MMSRSSLSEVHLDAPSLRLAAIYPLADVEACVRLQTDAGQELLLLLLALALLRKLEAGRATRRAHRARKSRRLRQERCAWRLARGHRPRRRRLAAAHRRPQRGRWENDMRVRQAWQLRWPALRSRVGRLRRRRRRVDPKDRRARAC